MTHNRIIRYTLPHNQINQREYEKKRTATIQQTIEGHANGSTIDRSCSMIHTVSYLLRQPVLLGHLREAIVAPAGVVPSNKRPRNRRHERDSAHPHGHQSEVRTLPHHPRVEQPASGVGGARRSNARPVEGLIFSSRVDRRKMNMDAGGWMGEWVRGRGKRRVVEQAIKIASLLKEC